MAQALVIEEEAGTCPGWMHPHNGYYAGDFSAKSSAVSARSAVAAPHLRVVPDQRSDSRTMDTKPVRWRDAA